MTAHFWRAYHDDAVPSASCSTVLSTASLSGDNGSVKTDCLSAILRSSNLELYSSDYSSYGLEGSDNECFTGNSGGGRSARSSGVDPYPATRLFFDWHDTIILRLRIQHQKCIAVSDFKYGARLSTTGLDARSLQGCDVQQRSQLESSTFGRGLGSSWRPLTFQLDHGASSKISMTIKTKSVLQVRPTFILGWLCVLNTNSMRELLESTLSLFRFVFLLVVLNLGTKWQHRD